MRSDEAILDEIIKDGSVEVDEWPELLKRLLTRLDHIAHNSFPTPPLPPPADIVTTNQPPPELSTQSTIPDAPSPNPETPAETPAVSPPPAHSQDVSATSSPRPMPPPAITPLTPPSAPDPPAEATLPPPGTITPDDLSVLTTLINILNTQFDTAPPYTVQRFAELLRNPNAHYRSLTKYLRALQRVLSVSSPVTAFPLPPSVVDTVPNGTAFTLGSDESLGGALLSPIPWLTPTSLTEEVSDETVNGVTQGELLRQEQELNIIPATQVTSPTPHGDELTGGAPPPLGPEDVGPQPEGTVFPDPPRTPEEARSPPPVTGSLLGGDTTMGETKDEEKEEEMKDASPEKEEKKDEQVEVEKKDDMDVDVKEAKELEDKMQLDAAADEKEEKEAKEAAKED